ncbi:MULTISPECIES: phosphatase PAP2 family protein [unclassified Janthinobacterium]|uniref:phosphatase PAP2 family protein n=1 Tax=unclassified Janthinobacterium TaxID=2610881 RepID=UPI001E4B8DD7|nr:MULTISPECIES: phosphatase PAP2 family protein [unclassified Janthinobacterium]MEC5159731.1 membrane-associated phospholipid phosphatase [Janthinobacterium sp. CG_S6]
MNTASTMDTSGGIDAHHRINTAAMTPWSRLRHLLLGWGGVGLVYFSTGFLGRPATVLPELALDRLIPYNPAGIWLYLSFFILIPYTYASVAPRRVRWLSRAMPLCAALSGVVFLLFPTTLNYPPLAAGGADAQLLQLLLASDSSSNCLPSLHGALTVLCVWALCEPGRPLRAALALLLGLAICYSIIQLRRHLSIDLGAGVLAGLLCGALLKLRAPAPAPLFNRETPP